jgi:hypothetical protein
MPPRLHSPKVASGEVARVQGSTIQVDEELSRDLRRQAESFIYSAARAYKEGIASERIGEQA